MGIELGIGAAIVGVFAGASAAAAGIGLVVALAIDGAIIGAAIGGLTAAVTGGSISKGMLFGAIGGAVTGGISGYMSPAYGGAATAIEGGTEVAVGSAGSVVESAATTSTEFGAVGMSTEAGAGAAGEFGAVGMSVPAETTGEGLLGGAVQTSTTAATPATTVATPFYKTPEVISGAIKAAGETGAKLIEKGTGYAEAAETTAEASKANLAAQLAAQREIEFAKMAEAKAARELPYTEAELARQRRKTSLSSVTASPTTVKGLLNA